MTRKQCSKCPWKTSTDPFDIPGNYSADKHCALKSTIADGEQNFMAPTIRIMACHETTAGKEKPCVGWLVHQLGVGNNIGLRLRVSMGQIDGDVMTVGPQHKRFEDTLPKTRKTMKIRYKHTVTSGIYDVYVDAVFVGVLYKFTKPSKLGKKYTSPGWRATTPTGEKLFDATGHSGTTRDEAAQALIKHATKDVTP